MDLLQPPALQPSQDAAKGVISEALSHNLVVEDADGVFTVGPEFKNQTMVNDIGAFRNILQKRLLGAVEEYDDNYLLSLVTAWYAVQDERVFRVENKSDFPSDFNRDMDPRSEDEVTEEGRLFNPTKFNAWLTWSSFLGYGREMKVGDVEMLLPNAYDRLHPLLPDLLPAAQEELFGDFMARLAMACPELDGGIVYEKCWASSRNTEARSNRVSLMVSTALRIMHEKKEIQLVYAGDAADVWTLFPAEGQPLSRVSHISRGAQL